MKHTLYINISRLPLSKICLFAALLMLPSLLWAQSSRNYRNTVYRNNNVSDHSLKLTAGIGGVSYTGELANMGQYIKPIFSGGIIYKIVPHVSFKGELSFFQLRGSDADGNNKFRNLSFNSRNLEAYGSIMYELFDVDVFSRGQAIIVNPYAFAGLGFVTVNPTTELNGTEYNLRKFKTEDVTYNAVTLAAPVGAGVRFELTRRLGLSVEAAYRFTFSDYLDDVSTTYINTSAVEPLRAALIDRGPEVGTLPAEPGAPRGNPAAKDGYLSVGLKVEYLLFPVNNVSKPKCPAAMQRKAPKVKK